MGCTQNFWSWFMQGFQRVPTEPKSEPANQASQPKLSLKLLFHSKPPLVQFCSNTLHTYLISRNYQTSVFFAYTPKQYFEDQMNSFLSSLEHFWVYLRSDLFQEETQPNRSLCGHADVFISSNRSSLHFYARHNRSTNCLLFHSPQRH